MARKRDESDDDDERSESELSGEESDVEEEDDDDEEEEDEDEDHRVEQAKHKLVDADLAEIRKMVEEMDKIKMRLQFRLAREQASMSRTVSPGGSSRRRSSVDEIYVPPTVATAVQTTWDMPRMYEMEKLVSSNETKPPASPLPREANIAPPPIGPSMQLSMQDLAKSYGIEDAVFAREGTNGPTSPVQTSSSTRDDYPPPSVRQASMKPLSSMWDALASVGGAGGATDSIDNGSSIASADKPPKLNRSQLTPDSESGERLASPVASSLGDSFGAPVSPTHTGAYGDSRSDSAHAMDGNKQGKTMEQKEMEAMKNLLFF